MESLSLWGMEGMVGTREERMDWMLRDCIGGGGESSLGIVARFGCALFSKKDEL